MAVLARSSIRAAVVAILAVPAALVACSGGDEPVGRSVSALPVAGGGDPIGSTSGGTTTKDAGSGGIHVLPPPIFDAATFRDVAADTADAACPGLRVDAHRASHACADILPPPADAAGSWRIEATFPSAPPEVRDEFCTYTWVPSTAACAAPLLKDLELEVDAGDAWNVSYDCPSEGARCGTSEADAGLTDAGPLKGGGGCPSCGRVADSVAYVVVPDRAHSLILTVKAADTEYSYVTPVVTSDHLEVALPPAPNGGAYDGNAKAEWW